MYRNEWLRGWFPGSPLKLFGKLRSSVSLLVAQERKVHSEHLDGVGAGFLLRDHPAMNGMGNRKVEVRVVIFREEFSSRSLMKLVDMVRELVGIDLAGTPSPELGLEFRELSGEVPFVGDRAQLAKPTALRFRELAAGLHSSLQAAQRSGCAT